MEIINKTHEERLVDDLKEIRKEFIYSNKKWIKNNRKSTKGRNIQYITTAVGWPPKLSTKRIIHNP